MNTDNVNFLPSTAETCAEKYVEKEIIPNSFYFRVDAKEMTESMQLDLRGTVMAWMRKNVTLQKGGPRISWTTGCEMKIKG